jgi:hypothetical protein
MRKIRSQRHPWALAFADALYTWLQNQDIDGGKLALELDIPLHTWYHAAAADTITQTEYYARIYCRTGINQADPRTVPVRRTSFGNVYRAWSNEKWQQWLSEHQHRYSAHQPDSDSVTAAVTTAPTEYLDPRAANLSQIIETLQTVLNQSLENPNVYQQLLALHGRQLGKIYSLISILKIEDHSDRVSAIKAFRRFNQ